MSATTINGTVIDADSNNGVPNATVTDLGNPANTQFTDASGNFTISVADSTKGLKATADNYGEGDTYPSANAVATNIYIAQTGGGLTSQLKANVKNSPIKYIIIGLVLVVVIVLAVKFKIWRIFKS